MAIKQFDTKTFDKFINDMTARRDKIAAQASELMRQSGQLSHFLRTLQLLKTSWSDEDPGKFLEHWFFVKSYETETYERGRGGEQFELVTKVQKFWVSAFIDDLEKAMRGRKSRHAHPKDPLQPVPLGKITDAMRRECDCCSKPAPVVGRYSQTRDTFDCDDIWELWLYALCTDCAALTQIEHRADGHRFI